MANLPNVPTVKIGNYAKRNSATLFYIPGQAPKPSDSEGHGGVYYNMENYGKVVWNNASSHVVPFERKVVDKKEQMKRIEAITKRAKDPDKLAQKNRTKQMAKENAEFLFNLLHGKEAKPRDRSQPRFRSSQASL